MKNYTVYYHKSPEGKYYIGQTCQTLEERWQNGRGYKAIKFKSAIDKFGWDNFEHGVLEENIPENMIDEKEAYYIELFDSVKNGYNTYNKNYSQYHFSDLWANPLTRQQMIIKLTQIRNTDEYKQQQSNIMKKCWESQEYRENQKKSWTDERKKATSERSKALWQNEEYRQTISKAQSEYRKLNWQNPEYRKKMCKQVQCVETGEIFESIKAAADWCGVKPNTLCAALSSFSHQSGKHPITHEKLHWRRYSDELGKAGQQS